ncbi:hypothetical protein QBC46DRAFT_400631 [Diplogelasinospora grovesii]|uniref:Uncharacterized protein n=1 Tax=Diplogelasinospora grovesii TaxID=303347 RepID=A0AAN6RZE9_9PEZI|nr:hypothetical protein QBC46DRAFT_400631 [Diplogelasinospora grovesii]
MLITIGGLHADELRYTLADSASPFNLPDLARVIYNERQLESFYHSTLITRVNIALHNTVPPGNPRVTVIMCPGSFNSYNPDYVNSKKTVILPDWIVIEGTYTLHNIIAVGDTKLVRQLSDANEVNKRGQHVRVIVGTHSYHRAYLAQVQHYARMLRTRFRFVLTNKELVVTQFLREEEATPRPPRQRGLKSYTLPQQVQQRPRGKRRHETSNNVTAPRSPLSLSPLAPSPQIYNLPSSPFKPALESKGVTNVARRLALTPKQHPPYLSSQDHPSPSPYQSDLLRLSSITYAPSERDLDVKRVLVQSFRIPNPCDEDGMDRERGNKERERVHPAEALFTLSMLTYSVRV